MKKMLMLFITCFTIGGFAQSAMSFKENTHDFGEIQTGDSPVFKFEFKNTGTESVSITGVKTSNDRIKAQWPKKAVKPGKKGTIAVQYITKEGDEINSFSSDIIISCTKEPCPSLHVSGAVVPGKPGTNPETKSLKTHNSRHPPRN